MESIPCWSSARLLNWSLWHSRINSCEDPKFCSFLNYRTKYKHRLTIWAFFYSACLQHQYFFRLVTKRTGADWPLFWLILIFWLRLLWTCSKVWKRALLKWSHLSSIWGFPTCFILDLSSHAHASFVECLSPFILTHDLGTSTCHGLARRTLVIPQSNHTWARKWLGSKELIFVLLTGSEMFLGEGGPN